MCITVWLVAAVSAAFGVQVEEQTLKDDIRMGPVRTVPETPKYVMSAGIDYNLPPAIRLERYDSSSC